MTPPRPDSAGSRRLVRAAFWAALVSVAILAFAPLAAPEAPDGLDKLNHLLAFAVLAWLAEAAYPQRPAPLRWGLLLGYGLLIEAVQAFLPYRDFSLLDLAADGAGILAAATMIAIARPRLRKTMATETRRAQRED